MINDTIVFTEPPEHFKPVMDVAACFIACDDKVLLLKRHAAKAQGDKWGLVGGRLEPHEEPLPAVIREINEETGITVAADKLQKIAKLYVCSPDSHFVYYLFCTRLTTCPTVTISDEHTEFRWVTIAQALQLPLTVSAPAALQIYQKFCDRHE